MVSIHIRTYIASGDVVTQRNMHTASADHGCPISFKKVWNISCTRLHLQAVGTPSWADVRGAPLIREEVVRNGLQRDERAHAAVACCCYASKLHSTKLLRRNLPALETPARDELAPTLTLSVARTHAIKFHLNG